jgi:hypothetical protein
MQRSQSYEWLLESCLQECRKGISHLEEIAAGDEPPQPEWLKGDLAELFALEAAAVDSLNALKKTSQASGEPDYTQERLDRLQAKLLESFQHLASESIQPGRES